MMFSAFNMRSACNMRSTSGLRAAGAAFALVLAAPALAGVAQAGEGLTGDVKIGDAKISDVRAGDTIIIQDDIAVQGIPSDVPMPPSRARAFRPRVAVAAPARVIVAPSRLVAAQPVVGEAQSEAVKVALRKPAPNIWLTIGDGF